MLTYFNVYLHFLSVFAATGVWRCLAALCAVWFLHSEQPFFSAALLFIEPPERGGAAQTTANPEGSAGWGGAWCHLYNPKKPCSRKWYETHMHGRFVNHRKLSSSSRLLQSTKIVFSNQLKSHFKGGKLAESNTLINRTPAFDARFTLGMKSGRIP